jgi:fatty acid synthase, animal type
MLKPLKTTVFEASEVQSAFRFLASGKHIGKVLIKVCDSDSASESHQTLPIAVKRQVFCNSSKSFIIAGGLGGFGLELSDLLVLRGCKNLILSSSRGITNGYQANRIK